MACSTMFFKWLAVLLLGGYIGYVNAYVKATFPINPNNTFPRMILSGTLPVLGEVTVCYWAKAQVAKPMYVLSYASGQADDEFRTGVDIRRYALHLTIRNQNVLFNVDPKLSPKVGEWNNYCFTWSSSGMASAYLDGQRIGTEGNIQPNKEIRGGGVLMVGQDQDVFNGKFDINESWQGSVYDVQIWDEVLQASQIAAMAGCKVKMEGNLFAWMKTPALVREGVIFSGTNLCKPISKDK